MKRHRNPIKTQNRFRISVTLNLLIMGGSDRVQQPLISVVIPVYKVEEYLDFCIQSVLSQTYTNLEVILVDDGSPDRCGEMCDQWACKDERVRVIHKPNGGLSDARNAGTAEASGQFVAYVDSDDWVSPTYIESMYTALADSQADLAICDMEIAFHEASVAKERASKPLVMTGEQAMATMFYQKHFETSAWAKLYDLEMMKANPFPVGRLYEDLFTTYKMLFAAKKVVYIAQPLYFYRMNPKSIMNRAFDRRCFDLADAVDEITAFVETNCPQVLPAAKARKFSAYCQLLRWMPKETKDGELLEVKAQLWRFIRSYRWKMMLDTKARLKNRIAAVLSLLGMRNYQRL